MVKGKTQSEINVYFFLPNESEEGSERKFVDLGS